MAQDEQEHPQLAQNPALFEAVQLARNVQQFLGEVLRENGNSTIHHHLFPNYTLLNASLKVKEGASYPLTPEELNGYAEGSLIKSLATEIAIQKLTPADTNKQPTNEQPNVYKELTDLLKTKHTPIFNQLYVSNGYVVGEPSNSDGHLNLLNDYAKNQDQLFQDSYFKPAGTTAMIAKRIAQS